jgi:hypothetical protein
MFRKNITWLLSYVNDLRSIGYYNNLNKNRFIETYLKLYSKCIDKEKVLIDTEICFSPTIKFGSTLEYVKNNNPHEYTILENTKECITLTYKIKEGPYRFRLEMHFFKNKLVVFKYIFRSALGEKTVRDLFTKKYLKLEEHRLPDFSKITLTDGLRNHIEIDNSVFFAVNYFTFKYGFFDYLKNINRDYQIQKVKGQDTEGSWLLKRI